MFVYFIFNSSSPGNERNAETHVVEPRGTRQFHPTGASGQRGRMGPRTTSDDAIAADAGDHGIG